MIAIMTRVERQPAYLAAVLALFALLASCAHQPVETPRADPPGAQPESPAPEEGVEPQRAPQPRSGETEGRPKRPEDPARRAAELSPTEAFPIRTTDSYLAQVVDVDNDGRRDVCLLTVRGKAIEAAPRLTELRDTGRLSSEDGHAPEFFFELYLARPDGLEHFDTRRIGRFPVVEGLRTRRLAADGAFPVALEAKFQDRIGSKSVWLVVGGNGLSTFMLEQTPVIRSRVVDIDNDGTLDVLKAQSAFEQGRGYETFLTWYRWDGNSFRPHATTNIVRNLNSYLATLEDHLVAGRLSHFLERSGAGGPESEAHARIAGLFAAASEEGPAFGEILAESEIRAVSFPDFLENPFPEPGSETSFTAPVRVDSTGGETFYFETRIVMTANPFASPQFRLRSPSSG